MLMVRQLIIAAVFLCGALGARVHAETFNLVGVWTLQSMSFVDEATGKVSKDFGEHPRGYVIYTPTYMSVVINAEGRQPVAAKSEQSTDQRAKLLMTMTAHAGPYTFANGKLVNKVEAAHDPAMVGIDLVRMIRVIDNNHVESTTPVTERPDGRRMKTILIWQRVSQA